VRLLFYDDLPEPEPPSIFLAGPTARGVPRTPWRAEALELLGTHGFAGTALLPEFRAALFEDAVQRVFGGAASPVRHMRDTSYGVLGWETAAIEAASVVLFWMPFRVAAADDPASLPGFTTRAEVARELARAPARVVLGMPPGALSGGHIRYHAHRQGVAIHDTLLETVTAALRALSER
jgi:hypothetical protein